MEFSHFDVFHSEGLSPSLQISQSFVPSPVLSYLILPLIGGVG